MNLAENFGKYHSPCLAEPFGCNALPTLEAECSRGKQGSDSLGLYVPSGIRGSDHSHNHFDAPNTPRHRRR